MRVRIVVASHTYLGGPFVVGGHQLARAWARAGHRVLLVSAPVTPWHAVRAGDATVRARFRRTCAPLREWEPGLQDCVPFGLFPWVWGAHLNRRLRLAMPSLTVGLHRTIRRAGFERPDLLLLDHPQFFNLDRTICARRFAYRSSDLFVEMHERQIVNQLEHALVTRADCVLATSEPVAQRLRDLGAARVTLVENGVEYAHFAAPVPPPPEYRAMGPRRVVYAGALDSRFGGELVVRLAVARPDVEFVIIGAGTAGSSALTRLTNIHRLGVRPYARLPGYLQHAMVGLLPLSSHPSNAGRSPMKFYEYAAAGLPIVATRTPELARRNEPFVSFFEAAQPELALNASLTGATIPDPAAIRAHDWALIGERVLNLALAR